MFDQSRGRKHNNERLFSVPDDVLTDVIHSCLILPRILHPIDKFFLDNWNRLAPDTNTCLFIFVPGISDFTPFVQFFN